jgi:hypothetical protein
MTDTVKIPLSERFNFRILLFAAAVAVIVGYPVYIFVDSALSGGIKDRGDYKEVDLKAMSDFPFDGTNGTIDDVPAQFRALDGQKILVRGEMYDPRGTGERVNHFILVYSIAKCCYSGPPKVQHWVQAKAVDDRISYYEGLVEVIGTLHVDLKRENGQVTQVYRMDVESVRPV